MPPLFQFIFRRLLVVITMILDGRVMLTLPEERAQSGFPARMNPIPSDGQLAVMKFGIAWNMPGGMLGDVLYQRAR